MGHNKTLTINALIEARGFRKDAVAGMLGMSPNSFYNRCGGRTKFTVSEVSQLSDILGIHETVLKQVIPLAVRKEA